jgi:hypothetical protein
VVKNTCILLVHLFMIKKNYITLEILVEDLVSEGPMNRLMKILKIKLKINSVYLIYKKATSF